MGTSWHYRLMGQEFGPVPFELLIELTRSGHLKGNCQVRRDSDSDWRVASEVPEIADDCRTHEWANLLDSLFLTRNDSHVADSESVPMPVQKSDNLPFWTLLPPLVRGSSHRNADRKASASKQDEWYFRILGQEFGPLPLEDLVSFAKCGELAVKDEVKPAFANQWRPADEFSELLPALIEYQRTTIDEFMRGIEHRSSDAVEMHRSNVVDQPLFDENVSSVDCPPSTKIASTADQAFDAEQMEARTENTPRPPLRLRGPYFATDEDDYETAQSARVERDDSTGTMPTSIARSIPTARDRIALRQIAALRFSPRRSYANLRLPNWGLKRIALVSCLCLTVLAVLVAAIRNVNRDNEHWTSIQSVWNEFQQLRGTNAAALAESDFLVQSRDAINAIVNDLESTSNTREPARQNMLWAARDHLLPILRASDKRDEQNELRFREQMRIAHGLLGLPPDQTLEVRLAKGQN